jgi:hypothetical protein
LTERERATGAQMVIAIFPSLEGESLEDFTSAWPSAGAWATNSTTA